MKHFFVFNK